MGQERLASGPGFDLGTPDNPHASHHETTTRQLSENSGEKTARRRLGLICGTSFILGVLFTVAMVGASTTSRHLSMALMACTAVIIALQVLAWRKARAGNTSPRIPPPVESPDRSESISVHECLIKAGFSEPPGVSDHGTVYTKQYWGTVYVYEGGYWQHQVALANLVLPFEGYGAKTLESHLRLLELTGRLTLAKA